MCGRFKKNQEGFTLVEIMISLAILGILVAIAIPKYRSYIDKLERATTLLTMENLMDGEHLYFLENEAYFAVNIPKGKAMDVPELAYSFDEGHKNRYRIKVTNNKRRDRYIITAFCDFDSDGNGKDDRFKATTDKLRGQELKYREIVQVQ